MEAMACARPVISTFVAGIPELVEDDVSGFVVPPGDVSALVAAIDALLRDPSLRSRLGAAGRATVEREFDIDAEGAWMGEILSSALAGVALPPRPKSSSVPVAATAPRSCPTP